MTHTTAAALLSLIAGLAAPGLAKSDNKAAGPTVLKGKLGEGDPTDRERAGCYCRVHEFPFAAGAGYQIRLDSSDFDPYLRLEGPDGKTLAADDDGGGGFSALILFTPDRPGKYRVVVTTFGPRQTGAYTLTVGPSGQGNIIQGKLTTADPFDRLRPARRSRTHQVPLSAGRPVTIDLTSTEFDTYLRLEDPAGKKLLEDDDSGGGRNARVAFTPPRDGTYRIVVTSFLPGATGAYTLRIRQEAPPEKDGGPPKRP
jgi:hypothetical protein